LNIEILGVNREDQEPFNYSITAPRSLPWLQDTSMDQVWQRWQVSYRDVWILDSQNRLFAVFNLTENDLADAENRERLKRIFLSAASVADPDADQLPDDWEQRFLGGAGAMPSEDPDADGASNFAEFAFGTDPKNSRSGSLVRTTLSSSAGQTFLSLTFRRRAGSILDYIVETSPDLEHWTASTAEVAVKKQPRNLYDGTGTSEVTYGLVNPVSQRQHQFVRVRAVPRKRP